MSGRFGVWSLRILESGEDFRVRNPTSPAKYHPTLGSILDTCSNRSPPRGFEPFLLIARPHGIVTAAVEAEASRGEYPCIDRVFQHMAEFINVTTSGS